MPCNDDDDDDDDDAMSGLRLLPLLPCLVFTYLRYNVDYDNPLGTGLFAVVLRAEDKATKVCGGGAWMDG
jgi:hypothetical protein